MKYVLFGIVAANMFVANIAFAKQSITDKKECVKYVGNWINAPHVSCGGLIMGNSVSLPYKKL